ncbi:MAG: maltokinase [Miltoncostaeaceae bacterium]|nr:maltokinase [Miltoncostaeaceae bacterium]
MIEAQRRMAAGDLGFIEEPALVEFVRTQRWFGGKSREVTHVGVLDAAPMRGGDSPLVDALVEVRYQAGTHDVYQLLIGLRDEAEPDCALGWADGRVAVEALSDPTDARELGRLLADAAHVEAGEGAIDFYLVPGALPPAAPLTARRLGAEQSNSSIVFDEELMLKAYRRLEPGVNPELELLRFLSERGFANIPELVGWYEYSGRLMAATLGIVQRFVRGGIDGWSLALEMLTSGDGDLFLGHAERLGDLTGRMHACLGSEPAEPAFAPEEPSAESLAILSATIEDEVSQLFSALPDSDALAPLRGLEEDVRERLRMLPHAASGGRRIRHHGDYHLGQVLWAGDDWMVLDFEGEPARSMPERRRKRSPLRDAAGMLRSFGYAAAAARQFHGVEPPPMWEERAREAFLEAYLPHVEAARLLPTSRGFTEELLRIFELEKAVYELRYELDHRPDWVGISVAGIVKLLEPAGP